MAFYGLRAVKEPIKWHIRMMELPGRLLHLEIRLQLFLVLQLHGMVPYGLRVVEMVEHVLSCIRMMELFGMHPHLEHHSLQLNAIV